MKKILALLLAAVMILSGSLALAESQGKPPRTVDAHLTIDREIAGTVMERFGVDQGTRSSVEPVIALLSDLNVKVVRADSGLEMDLDLRGRNVFSLGMERTEKGLSIGSSLFPNHLITLSHESLRDVAKQYMQNIPAIPGLTDGMLSTGDSGGTEETAGTQEKDAAEKTGEEKKGSPSPYSSIAAEFEPFLEACRAAVTPGEAEQGTFEFEGHTFDTRTPMNVDVRAIAEAEKKLVSDLLKNESFLKMVKSVPGFDAEKLRSFNEEAMSEEHLPETTVNVYTNSDGSKAFYVVSESTTKGSDSPVSRYTLYSAEDGSGNFTLEVAAAGLTVTGVHSSAGLRVDCTVGETCFAFSVEREKGHLHFDLFCLEKEKPLLSLDVTAAAAGVRTLSLGQEGRTVVTLEDLISGKGGEGSGSLVSDIMTNGLGGTLAAIQEAVPESENLLRMLTSPQGGPAENAAPAEAAPADPST